MRAAESVLERSCAWKRVHHLDPYEESNSVRFARFAFFFARARAGASIPSSGARRDEGMLVGALMSHILAIPATQNTFWVAGMAKMAANNAPTSIPSSPRTTFGARSGFNQGRGFAPTPWDCSGAGAPPPRSVPRAVHSPRWQYPASCQRDARRPVRGIGGAVCSE
jgi:hypothetical protein